MALLHGSLHLVRMSPFGFDQLYALDKFHAHRAFNKALHFKYTSCLSYKLYYPRLLLPELCPLDVRLPERRLLVGDVGVCRLSHSGNFRQNKLLVTGVVRHNPSIV
jgi:hypothetical protein